MTENPGESRPRQRRGFGSIYQRNDRGGLYFVKFTWDGKTYVRIGGATQRKAEKLLDHVRALLEVERRPIGSVLATVFGDAEGAPLSFKSACASYLPHAKSTKRASTYAVDVQRLRGLCEAPWAGKPLGRVTTADVEGFLEALQRPSTRRVRRDQRPGESLAEYRRAPDRWQEVEIPGATGATCNRYASAGSALYLWAARRGYVPKRFNPFRDAERRPESKPRDVWLTPAEGDALIAHASGYLRPLLLALLHSGIRRGEALTLTWRNVDFSRRVLVIDAENEKAGRGRTVPMTPRLHSTLTDLHARRPRPSVEDTDLVFCLPDGGAIPSGVLWRDFERTVRSCEGIPASKRGALVLHSCRHSFATNAAAAGVPLHALSALLGHSVAATTARYAHHSPDAQRAAMDLVIAALDPAAPKAATKGA